MTELSAEGREQAQFNWLASSAADGNDLISTNFTASDYIQVATHDDDYWDQVWDRTVDFLMSPEGAQVAYDLNHQLEMFLLSNQLWHGLVPITLYDKIVEVELAWRLEVRTKHKLEHPELYERKFKVEITSGFNTYGDTDHNWTLHVPEHHTFTQFLALLKEQTQKEAKEVQCPGGFTLENGGWFYEWYDMDEMKGKNVYHLEAFHPINDEVYQNLRELLFEIPVHAEDKAVQITLWHASQIVYVRTMEKKPRPEKEEWWEAYNEWGRLSRPGYTREMASADRLRRRPRH